ncbi:hypothetical protein FACS1894141_2610 [Spirochaetia bacterium]|nr:hypothetical protein FACS1894141_2610 [Spirochaetia bacterium]
MEKEDKIYDAARDEQFQRPFIDIDERRQDGTIPYRYIHGGFEGTEARFAFFFPEQESYRGRFFQFMAPVEGSENASIGRKGLEDKIGFALTHGAYFIETNMGIAVPFAPIADPTMLYRSSAAAAEYSRTIAAEMYGPHRPYGYVYGGSGGGFKSTSCFESTNTWDGAAPYIIGSPMAVPNVFTVIAHARRILRHKLAQIADAVEAGGSGDPYAGLNGEEREALEEITRMGFPLRTWFKYKILDDGALPVLVGGVMALDRDYYRDFWTVPGYLGADPNSSAARDRIRHRTKALEINVPPKNAKAESDEHKTGADEAWQRMRGDKGINSRPWLRLESIPSGDDLYLYGTTIEFLSGEAAGCKVPLKNLEGGLAIIGAGFGLEHMPETLAKVKPGDEVLLDNSDYIAIQTLHRHQVPDSSFTVWDQFRNADGTPKYPQRPVLIGPIITRGGAGSLQSGVFRGKMILTAALMDESAFPWQPDWYRRKVQAALGNREAEQFRLWYMDRALHDDQAATVDELQVTSYLGGLHQALLDLAAWVEKGIVPPESTGYTVHDGQLSVPPGAVNRRGIQPVVSVKANGAYRAEVKAGEAVRFIAEAEVPPGAGKLTAAEWSFEGETDYPVKGELGNVSADGTKAVIEAVHAFAKPGTYFPVLRAASQREGNPDDVFTQVKNLCRVRVIVK